MTEAEALDEAAKAAGWGSWDFLSSEGGPMLIQSIRAHAATLMENAALKAENERLRHAVGVAIRNLEEAGYKHKGYALTTLTTALKEIGHGDR